MPQLTLDEMYYECAIYTDNHDIVKKTGGVYTGEALTLVNRFRTSINYAKGKIVREKFTPTYTEVRTLDGNRIFDLSNLSKDFLRLIKLKDSDGNEISKIEPLSTQQIKLPLQNPNDTITITYGYMPSDLVQLEDILDLPFGAVDARVLCFFAAYQYHLIEGGGEEFDKANYYLGLWNDGLENITANFGNITSTVRVVYGGD